MFKKILVSLSGILAITACAPSNLSPQSNFPEESSDAPLLGVVGGKEVSASSVLAKTVLKLHLIYKERVALCSATAISKRVLITAAHCIKGKPQRILTTLQGVNLNIEAKSYILHENRRLYGDYLGLIPSLDGNGNPIGEREFIGHNDLALVILKKDLPSSVNITKLYQGNNLPIGKSVIIAGFGLSSKDPIVNGERVQRKNGRDLLNEGLSTIVEKNDKDIILKNSSSVCDGDSGGPIFIKTNTGSLEQVGVTSANYTDTRGNDTCLGTSVSESIVSHRSWIEYNLKKINLYLKVTN